MCHNNNTEYNQLPQNHFIQYLYNTTTIKKMNIALHSAFDAAIELDTFLHQQPVNYDTDESYDDDSSIASELKRLQDSEESLRRELEGIHIFRHTHDDDSQFLKGSFSSADCDNSVEHSWSLRGLTTPIKKDKKLYSDIPTLLPSSPCSNEKSESSMEGSSLWHRITSQRSAMRDDVISSPLHFDAAFDPEVVVNVRARRPSISFGVQHQMRDEILRKHQNEVDETILRTQDDVMSDNFRELIDDEDYNFFVSDDTNKGVIYRLANILFGRAEYSIKYAHAKHGFKRSIQGNAAIGMAAAIAVLNTFAESPHLSIALALLPVMTSVMQTKLPDKTSEVSIALSILAIQSAVNHITA